MPAVLEIRAIADCCYQRGCGLGTNPADPGDPWADLAVFEDRLNLLIESPDVIVDLEHEGVQAGDDVPHHWCQLLVGRRQDFWNELLRSRGPDCERDPAVEQEPAHLADHCGAMIYQPLARTVQSLDIWLLERLLRHKAPVSLLQCGTNRLGITGIVLLASHERLYILGGDDLHGVPQPLVSPKIARLTAMAGNRILTSTVFSATTARLLGQCRNLEYDLVRRGAAASHNAIAASTTTNAPSCMGIS